MDEFFVPLLLLENVITRVKKHKLFLKPILSSYKLESKMCKNSSTLQKQKKNKCLMNTISSDHIPNSTINIILIMIITF